MHTKLLEWAKLLEQEQAAAHPSSDSTVRTQPGKKYIRIIIGSSARYFVEFGTGTIYGSESWSKPNLRRQFGTLGTVDQFEWGGYEAKAKPASDFVMIQTSGPYFTAVRR